MNMNRNMGPRGPMYGRRGFGRRMHSPAALPLILLGGLFGAPVILGAVGIAVAVIGAVFSGLAIAAISVISALRSVFTGIFAGMESTAGMLLGILAGLILYFRFHGTRGNSAAKEETRQESSCAEEEDFRIYHTDAAGTNGR